MRARFDAKLNMYRTVAQLVTDEQTRFNAITGFPLVYAPYATLLTNVEPWVIIALSDPNIEAGIVLGYKQSLANAAELVANFTGVYASVTNNPILMNIMNVKATALVKEKKDRLPAICQTIYDEADAVKVAAADYGLTQDALDALDTANTTYSAAANNPRIAHGKLKTANEMIDKSFDSMDRILNEQLDRLVATVATSDPTLLSLWKTARTIIDPATEHTTLTITVTNTAGEPVENAECVLTKLDMVKTVITDEFGIAYIPTIGSGDWAVSATASGYQPYSLASFKIINKEDNALNITLIAQ
ncbi:MAG: hypothetical protein GC192_00520 [Bacteroidetes bacterium]|nr:hypothetical protein [Bacteroidota bacterium]